MNRMEECRGAHMKLAGKVALITGGGSGIGAASARRMAAEGAAITVLGRTEATLQEVAEKIERQGGQALAVRCDVAVPDEVERAFAAAVERFGRLDVVVAN